MWQRFGTQHEKGQDARLMKTGGVEIGKALADKSKGLFSANDWQCRTCGNVNWARRMDCNMCGTPKYGKVEERTGYGGGFNEREDVEYIERDESDGEYDEFGRKKKKFRGQGPPVASILVTEGKKEEDEEEEQNDLSKYKLEDEDKDKDKNEDEDEDESEDNEEEGDASKYDLAGSDSSGESGLSASRSSSRSSSRSHSLRRRSSQSPRRPSSHSRSGSSGSDTSIHHGSASTGEKERCRYHVQIRKCTAERRGEDVESPSHLPGNEQGKGTRAAGLTRIASSYLSYLTQPHSFKQNQSLPFGAVVYCTGPARPSSFPSCASPTLRPYTPPSLPPSIFSLYSNLMSCLTSSTILLCILLPIPTYSKHCQITFHLCPSPSPTSHFCFAPPLHTFSYAPLHPFYSLFLLCCPLPYSLFLLCCSLFCCAAPSLLPFSAVPLPSLLPFSAVLLPSLLPFSAVPLPSLLPLCVSTTVLHPYTPPLSLTHTCSPLTLTFLFLFFLLFSFYFCAFYSLLYRLSLDFAKSFPLCCLFFFSYWLPVPINYSLPVFLLQFGQIEFSMEVVQNVLTGSTTQVINMLGRGERSLRRCQEIYRRSLYCRPVWPELTRANQQQQRSKPEVVWNTN
uniref:zinc finger Ran-binding domain-containing protein 2 isoform X2 n=1 Tax=Myxine glutinosa TaxID=7769 RepID=UPI0035901EE0